MTGQCAITLRPAQRRDAADLAIIDNMASHGLSFGFWQHAIEKGEAEDALVYGRERFADPSSIFGYSNAIVAEQDEVIVGAATSYVMTEPDDDADEIKRVFPDFAPVFNLFARCVGDWFVDSLGVFPRIRAKGIGAMLLDAAMERGTRQKKTTSSLVVESTNRAARALYSSRGYVSRDQLPLLRNGSPAGDEKWLLMSAKLG